MDRFYMYRLIRKLTSRLVSLEYQVAVKDKEVSEIFDRIRKLELLIKTQGE